MSGMYLPFSDQRIATDPRHSQVLAMLHCLREVCSHAALITRDGYAFIRPGEEADESNRNEEIMRAEQVAGPDFVLRMRERYKKAALARVAAQQPVS